MRYTNTISSGFLLVALSLSGCGENASMSDSDAMPEMQNGSDQGLAEYRATGTLNSINEAEGTVNISHGPVDAIGWPAMTMDFRLADPESIAVLSPGQEIDFSFNTKDGATVTNAKPLD